MKGLVVVDEIQRRLDLFPLPRVPADRRPLPARFLILGSTAPELLRPSYRPIKKRGMTSTARFAVSGLPDI